MLEKFIDDILVEEYGTEAELLYEMSPLIQYLNKKMKAIHGDSKARRSLANIYAIYSILYFYVNDFYQDKEKYKKFQGYDYMKLFNFYRGLYGGSKLQNHALNSRVNGEFRNKFSDADNDLIIINNGKYLLHIDYLYFGNTDISKICCRIIEKYVELLMQKDHQLLFILKEMQDMNDYDEKKAKIIELLDEKTEARIFEIISYAILKNHYKNTKVYFGYERNEINEYALELFKTGRTNANDGGIDFVMRPIGRFFQVTEVNNYDKYLLDIDKVLHFPVTFVVRTESTRENVLEEIEKYISRKSSGMQIVEERYRKAIEDIVTICELKQWSNDLDDADIDNLIRDIDIYYKLEMNMDEESE